MLIFFQTIHCCF